MARTPRGIGKVVKSLFAPAEETATAKIIQAGKTSPADPMVAAADVKTLAEKTSATAPVPEGGRTDVRNINLDRLDVPEEYEKAIDAISVQSDNAGYQRKSIESIRAEYDIQYDEILDHLVGKSSKDRKTLMNAAQIDKARVLNAEQIGGYLERQDEFLKKVELGTVSDMDKIEMQRDLYRTRGLQSAVQGEVRELGRALRMLRENVGPVNSIDIKNMLDASGKGNDIIQTTKNIKSAVDQAKDGSASLKAASKAIQDNGWFTKAGQFVNAAVGYRTTQLLWSPKTHMRNIVGNSITNLLAPIERGMASVISGIPGVGSGEIVSGEMMAMFRADMGSFRDALKLAGKTFKTKDSVFGGTKLDDTRYFDIPEDTNKYKNSIAGRVADASAATVMSTGRALLAEDEFFKVLAFNQNMRALSVRQAVNEGLSGKAMDKRITELMSGPNQEKIFAQVKKVAIEAGDDADLHLEMIGKLKAEEQIFFDMYKESIKFANYQTFTDALTTKIGKAGHQFTNNPFIKMIVPFYRTPANILSYSLERSPLAFLAPETFKNLKAGGAARDLAYSRITMGSMTTAAVWSLAANGNVTGSGPPNRNLAKVYEAANWRQYSVNVGGRWVSYMGLDPFSSQFAVIATAMDINRYATSDKQREHIATVVTVAIAEQLKDRSFFEGLSRFFDAIEALERGGSSSFVGSMAASFVPFSGLLRTTTQVTDGIRRSTVASTPLERAINEIQRIIPVWSQGLPPQRDIWGEARKYDNAIGPDIMSPFGSPDFVDDPIASALSFNAVPVSKVMPIFGDGSGNRIDSLTMEDGAFKYDELQMLVGQARRKQVDRMVGSSLYKKTNSGPADQDDKVLTQGDLLYQALKDGKQRGQDQFIKNNMAEIRGMIASFATDSTYWPDAPKATKEIKATRKKPVKQSTGF